MDLKVFHLVFITLSVILALAVGIWAVGVDRFVLAAVALGAGVALVVYERYFLGKTRKMDLR